MHTGLKGLELVEWEVHFSLPPPPLSLLPSPCSSNWSSTECVCADCEFHHTLTHMAASYP